MNFGPISSFILFGGGPFLIEFSRLLRLRKIPFEVFTSERNLTEIIENGHDFSEILRKDGVKWHVSKDIGQEPLIQSCLSPTTMGMSFAAPWIFKQAFIERFGGRLVNTHGAKLPAYRGGGGFSWQILRGSQVCYRLIHQIDSGIDTGKILLTSETVFRASCRTHEARLAFAGTLEKKMYETFLDRLRDQQDFSAVEQQEQFSTYFPRLHTKIHGAINWSWPTLDIERFICAFDEPYPGAFTYLDGKRTMLKECRSDFNDGVFHPFQCGLVFRKTAQAVFVATLNGTLIVEKVMSENGDDMKKDIRLGSRFFTPSRYLEESMTFNAVYTGAGLKQ